MFQACCCCCCCCCCRGYGVRSLQRVRRGSYLLEYAGEVIDDKELAKRMEAAKAAGEPCYYIMELGPGLFIDARSKGNMARLLNSSCDPNCETQKWHDAATGEPRIGIFAKRDIEPGEVSRRRQQKCVSVCVRVCAHWLTDMFVHWFDALKAAQCSIVVSLALCGFRLPAHWHH
jgi:hypothetical protein